MGIRIGVIGAGNMGRNHIRLCDNISDFDLIGLYDNNTETAAHYAKSYNIRAYNNLEELFNDVDAVTIAAPSFLHKELTLSAIKHGCHVLTEKPLALSSADALEMIDACKDSGLISMVGHVERFNPAVTELANVLHGEEIISLDFTRLSPFDARISDADVVFDLMVHDLDVLCGIVDSPISLLHAECTPVFSERSDFAKVLLRHENGVIAGLTASRITESKVRRIEINTKKAYILVNMLTRQIEIFRSTRFTPYAGYMPDYRQENIIERVLIPGNEPLRNELEHFAGCIKNNTKPLTDFYAGYKAISLCEQISKK